MNSAAILNTVGLLGLVLSVGIFIWACVTRQFTGYDFGKLPLKTPEDDDVAGKPAPLASRRGFQLQTALLIAGMTLAFGVIGWTIYLVLIAASRVPAGG